jgi:hypothetical protein
MEVKLQPVEGYNLGTKKKVRLDRYWVQVDNKAVGFVDYDSPGQICFIRTGIGPLEKEQISEEVSQMLNSKTKSYVEPPEVPDEILNKDSQGEEFYEFDEEDVAGEGSN